MKRTIFALLTALCLLFACPPSAYPETQPAADPAGSGLAPSEGITIPVFSEENMSKHKFEQITPAIEFVRNLRAGWNLGNTFDAFDAAMNNPKRDYETYWCGVKTTQPLIHAVHEAGFNMLRIPVSWHNHLLDSSFTIDPEWLARVKTVAGWALEEGMYVIINIHHDNQENLLYPDPEHYDQSEKYLTAIWSQVAEAFAGYDAHLIFESMNEPRLVGTEYEWNPDSTIPRVREAMQCINRLNQRFVETVRASGGLNAERFLMVPGYSASGAGVLTDAFVLPADERVIVSVHAYIPYGFALDMNNPDSSFSLAMDLAKKEEILALMGNLYEKYIRHGVPVVIGEFGALRKTDSDLQARVNHAAFYTAAAASYGIPVAVWDNSNFSRQGEQFGLIDRKKVEWIYPDIALAIVQNSTPSEP